MGVSDINDECDIKTKSPYKLTTQILTPKQSSSYERAIMDVRSDLSKIKFHRKFETPAGCFAEYKKERILQAVK